MTMTLEQQLIELTADELEAREKAGEPINSALFLDVTLDISMNHPNVELRKIAKDAYEECLKFFKTHEIVYKNKSSLDKQNTRDLSHPCKSNGAHNGCKIFRMP